MKAKDIKTASNEHLADVLKSTKNEYASGNIKFGNSKGEDRALPYNRIDRLGKFVGKPDEDKDAFDTYLACVFRAQHEQKKAASKGASIAVKAGHSMKAGTTSLNLRTSKMDAKKTDVTVQLARAESLANTIHAIEKEQKERQLAAEAKALEDKAAAEKSAIEHALMGVTQKAA